MSDGIAKQLTYRIAADYERLAQSVEHRPKRVLPILEVVPAEVRQFAPSKITSRHRPDTLILKFPAS
jgi:hypothetical protein